jgi:hypothetical protein
MGNKSSRDVSATMEMISSTVVSSNKSCLALAQNKVLIQVGRADNVTIRNVDITQIANAEVDCIQESTIQIGSTIGNVEEALDQIIAEVNASRASLHGAALHGASVLNTESTTVKVTNRIATALTKQMVSACLAESVNDFTVRVKEVQGDFTMQNFSIEQIAHAHVKTCLQSDSVLVGDVPLVQYVTNNFKDGTIGLRPGWEQYMPAQFSEFRQKEADALLIRNVVMGATGIALLATAAAGTAAFTLPPILGRN